MIAVIDVFDWIVMLIWEAPIARRVVWTAVLGGDRQVILERLVYTGRNFGDLGDILVECALASSLNLNRVRVWWYMTNVAHTDTYKTDFLDV